MGAYVAIKISFSIYDNDSNIVKKLHELYKNYGMEPIYVDPSNVSYEEACLINQRCFNNMVEFDEHKHCRITWKCDWVSSIDTLPNIQIILPEYDNGRPYDKIKEEWLLFRENEITSEVFQKILKLITDLYNMDYVHAVKIEKEE